MQLTRTTTDVLKGVAVIVVIISHFLGGGYEIRYFTPLGGIGVGMFLFLSGYGINESFQFKGLGGFWKKKIVRIGVPYFLWCLMLLALRIVTSYHFPVFPRYWYLEYLFLWYFIYWVSRLVIPDYSIIFMLFVAVLLFPIMHNTQSEQSLSFLIGVLFSENKNSIARWSRSKSWIIILSLFVLATICLGAKQIPLIRELGEEGWVIKLLQLGTKLPYGMAIIMLLGMNDNNSNHITKVLSFVGGISLELYLVQMQLYGYIAHSVERLLIVTLITALLSWILHISSKYTQSLVHRFQRINNNKT